jgi:hypothetical protein
MIRRALCIAFVIAVVALAGCRDDTPLEGDPVKLDVAGRAVTLQLGDCRVYRVERNFFGSVRKTRVLSSEFYPFFTVCTRQSLVRSGDYAIASLCRQAIGAGGGCASSGTYRTKDGEKWEKESRDGSWVALDEPPAEGPPASTPQAPPPQRP